MSATSDQSLIERIAGSDSLAMRALFVRHHVRVYRFVLRLVGNQQVAEDLVSEVFLDIWRLMRPNSRRGRRFRPGFWR
jgi:RNA polymerase sigma-70 factor, ECF subfamily